MEPCMESDLTLRDLKESIDSMCPVRLYIDDQLIWDDFADDDIKIYDEALDSDKIIACIVYETTDWHHSIAKITLKQGD